jgi:magnesium transporter
MSFTLITYSKAEYQEKELDNLEDSFPYLDSGDGNITWLQIDSIQEEALVNLTEHFGIPPLIRESIITGEQRSKAYDLDKTILMTLKNYNFEAKDDRLRYEQIKILIGSNFLISFCEKKNRILDEIKEEIRTGAGRTRRMGADYLAYTILDSVIDNYQNINDTIETRAHEVGKGLHNPAGNDFARKIEGLVQEVVNTRRSIIPLGDVANTLRITKSELVTDSITIYLEEAHDHTVAIKELLDSNYEILSRMIDIYSTTLSNRANKVMQTLTIVATIFIPLTFIVGIYGMNFQIPEIKLPYGYPVILIFMLLVALLLLYYFRKKGWM